MTRRTMNRKVAWPYFLWGGNRVGSFSYPLKLTWTCGLMSQVDSMREAITFFLLAVTLEFMLEIWKKNKKKEMPKTDQCSPHKTR